MLRRQQLPSLKPTQATRRRIWFLGLSRPTNQAISHPVSTPDGRMDQRPRRAPHKHQSYTPGVSNDPNSTPNHNDPGDRQLPKSTTATATTSTSPSNRANFLDVGPAIRILTVNTEGLTYTKRVILASLCEEHGVDVLCLQETHIEDDAPTTRLKIANFDLLAFSGQ